MEQLTNVINTPYFFVSVAAVFGLYLVSLSVILSVWTYRDIKTRTNNVVAKIAAPAIVLLFGFAGFVPYLVLRPRQTFAERQAERQDVLLLAEAAKKFECPTCFSAVEPDFAVCPQCKAEFKPVCQCGAVLNVSWKRCPFCSTDVAAEVKTRNYAKPIPALDLPPAVEPAPKLAATVVASVKKTMKDAESVAEAVEEKKKIPEIKVSSAKVSVPAKKAVFASFSTGLRKAFAIKR